MTPLPRSGRPGFVPRQVDDRAARIGVQMKPRVRDGSGRWPRFGQRSEPEDTRAATADEASRTSERGRLVVDRVVEPCGDLLATVRSGSGVGRVAVARLIGAHHDQAMSSSILDFYRSATPNVAADWWQDAAGARRSRGLVLLLPDPPEAEAMAIEVAETMGAATARLDRLEHCWMAEAPERVA
jgi:hypothetical protein